MEIVSDNARAPIPQLQPSLDEEREKMQMTIQKVADINLSEGANEPSREFFSVPARRPSFKKRESCGQLRTRSSSNMQRAHSLRQVRPVPQGARTANQRTLSNRALSRANSGRSTPRRAPPGRTDSYESVNSLRAFRREQLVNTPVESRASSKSLITRGPGLERYESNQSIMTTTDLDSCFTMDSINLRKSQLVADPLDDGNYTEADSYADHETASYYSESFYSEHYPDTADGRAVDILPVSGHLGLERLKRLNSNSLLDRPCDVSFISQSFSTLASGDYSEDYSEFDELDHVLEGDGSEFDDEEEKNQVEDEETEHFLDDN